MVAVVAALAAIIAVAAGCVGFAAISIARAQRVAEQDAALRAQTLSAGGAPRRPKAESRAAAKREQAAKSRLGEKLAAADIDATPGMWLGGTVVAAAAAAAAGGLAFGNILLGVVFCMLVAAGSSMYLSSRAKKVSERFAAELAGALPQVAENMRTGMTVERALSTVASHTDEPLRSELSRACREMSLGGSLADSLDTMAARTESKDVKLVATAVALQRETGGNLAEVLDMVSEKIQARLRLRRHVKSITSSARAQRYILCCLPWAALGLSFFNAENAADFWRSFAGIAIICIAVVLEVVGAWFMQKICDMKID